MLFFVCDTSARTYAIQHLRKAKVLWWILGVGCIINLLVSFSPPLTMVGIGKLIEMVGFGVLLNYFFRRRDSALLIYPFLAGTTVQCVLALWQYVIQGSVGSIWYYLGERTFTGLTPGIANASLSGHLILRPYGTLPHPNLLGAYLLIASVLLAFILLNGVQEKRRQSLLWCVLTLHIFVLFLTLSRTSIIAGGLGFILILFSKKYKANLIVGTSIVLSICCLLFLLPIVSQRFMDVFTDQAYVERIQYIRESIHLIKTHLAFGVGWNAYLPTLGTLTHITSIQPVHSIFLLTLTQIGVVGFAMLVYPLSLFMQRVKTLHSSRSYVLVISLLVLGSFDHYFLTLQQGMLLFVFIILLAISPKQ